MPVKYMQCGPKCRSRRHAYEINAAISKGSLCEIQRYCGLCYNGGQLCDIHGRSALHMAAGCGKVGVVEWLLEERQGDVTQKDTESGWTPLHKAIFYGHLNTARLLIQYKSDLYTRDHEGLGPLDIAMKDRGLIKTVPPPVYDMTDNHEVFTWGDNSNFTLGHVSEQRRHTPEVVDEFRKHATKMKQIVMCTYHTVFLTSEGKVYTCGHGLGGRLGHPTEETCLVPRQIGSVAGEVCIEVAAARDHTLLLTQSGVVHSCGTNTYQQLGQITSVDKCLVPRPVNSKMVKGRTVKGVCAGRFHSVLYTGTAVFTCGLNAGQLGHPKTKGDGHTGQLRQVSALNVSQLCIVTVTCSDAATVILTQTGEIYVLHEYQCRKIASNRPDIARLYVVGGNLDHTDSQVLRENGGQQLVISFLNHSGKVFIWREKSPSLKRAHWLIRRLVNVCDFILTENGLGLVTDCGQVYVGILSSKPPPVREIGHSNKESTEGEFGRMSLLELMMQEEIEEVQVRRIPNIHRASYITADRKGHNYATLQSLPNSILTDVPTVTRSEMSDNFSRFLSEVDEYDLIHDIILQVDDQKWPAHKFILVNRCANFLNLLATHCPDNNETDIPVIHIADIQPQILDQMLLYIYTDTCHLLSLGAKFSLTYIKGDNHSTKGDHHTTNNHIFHLDLENEADNDTTYHKVSAFQVHQKNKSKKKKNESSHSDQKSSQEHNPVKMLQEAARKWGVKGLSKRLDCVKYHAGYIQSTGKQQPRSSLQFYRDKLRDSKWELYDVRIQSDDGVVFQCHKCLLVARLEYFHSMLASGWMETSSSTALTLPISGDILEILLDYLYTDESQVVNNTQNVEFLCNILVVADQMLVTRLKDMCEASIATLVTLKNVGELLEFASMYNAGQLKATCQQYIVINLPAILEGRYLDILSDDVIDDLTKYYRDSIDNMSRRIITPYDEGPEKGFLESLVADDTDVTPLGASVEPKKTKSKKKRNRTKSGTEDLEKGPDKTGGTERGYRRISERQISVSSDISVKSDEDTMETVEHLSVDCTGDNVVLPATSPPGRWGEAPVSPAPPTGVWSIPQAGKQSHPTQQGDSLRSIMAQDKMHKGEGHKHGTSGQKTRFSWKETKKQQQQHKDMKLKSSTAETHTADITSISSPTDTTQGVCPWGSLNKVVKSFRSLMVEEQTVSKPVRSSQPKTPAGVKPGTVDQGHPGSATRSKVGLSKHVQVKPHSGATNVVSWGLPKSGMTSGSTKLSVSVGRAAPQGEESPRSPDNPWTFPVAQSPPDAITTTRFSDIIQDEIHRTDVLIKTSNKPLALIQIEEQAIQDLRRHYNADTVLDETITVERVPVAMATPLWKRERLKSS